MRNSNQTEVWTKTAKLLAVWKETMAAQLKTGWKNKFTEIVYVIVNKALIK